jgi:hypothetical protein
LRFVLRFDYSCCAREPQPHALNGIDVRRRDLPSGAAHDAFEHVAHGLVPSLRLTDGQDTSSLIAQ